MRSIESLKRFTKLFSEESFAVGESFWGLTSSNYHEVLRDLSAIWSYETPESGRPSRKCQHSFVHLTLDEAIAEIARLSGAIMTTES
jgi:hypothetical protein